MGQVGHARRYWLMKSEPDAYGWDDLVAAGEGTWDGVRSHAAAANLRAMAAGDQAFFYHSNIGLAIVGTMEITATGLADPSDPTGKWAAVKVRPLRPLPRPVSLREIKAEPALAAMALVRQSRLSVGPVLAAEWERILAMAAAAAGTETAHQRM